MPLVLKPRAPLAPFTFSLSPSPPPPDTNGDASSSINALANAPRPPAEFIPEKDMYMFGTYPLLGAGEVGRGMIKCQRCGKVGLEWAAGEHRRICNHVLDGAPLTTKKTAKANKTTDPSKKRRASEVSESASVSPTKKRAKIPVAHSVDEEEDDDDEPLSSYKGLKKSEIKKIQKDKARAERREQKEKEKMEIAERKRQRATNPIDLDRQCGVYITDKKIPCARSLTCKTHTVGAKRAVEGRTRPYDELYIEWQRANNPNYKEPQKREKIEKEKKVVPSSLSGLDGKPTLKKKKFGSGRSSGLGDEGLRDDEDGLREMEELVAITRLAGERVRNTFGRHGFGPITSAKAVPPVPGRQNSSGQVIKSASSNGHGGTSANANTHQTPTATTSSASTASSSTSSKMGNTIPFLSVWRSSSNEYTYVGSMLTKALAARVKPQHKAAPPPSTTATSTSKAAAGGGAGRIPMTMTTGQGLPNGNPMSSTPLTIPSTGMNHAQSQAQAQAFAQAQAQALAHQAQMARQQLAAASAQGGMPDGIPMPINQPGMYGVTA